MKLAELHFQSGSVEYVPLYDPYTPSLSGVPVVTLNVFRDFSGEPACFPVVTKKQFERVGSNQDIVWFREK